MADVKWETLRAAVTTGAAPTTQDFTISGFGTPKAAFFIYTSATVDDTVDSDVVSRIGYGFADGTRQWAFSGGGEDNRTTTDTRLTTDTAAIFKGITGVGGLDFEFAFDSFITDGVRISVSDSASTAFLVTVVLIGGADVNAVYCDTIDSFGSSTATVNVTAPGFRPGAVLAICPDEDTLESGGPGTTHSIGMWVDDGSDTQKSILVSARDGQSTTENYAVYYNNRIGAYYSAFGLPVAEVTAAGITGGFSLTPSSDTIGRILLYAAIEFTNSPDVALFDVSLPTSGSGNYAETSPGFEPSFGMIAALGSYNATANSEDSTGVYGESLIVFDSTNVYSNILYDQDAVTTSNVGSISSDQFRVVLQDGTNGFVAPRPTFDSAGWDTTPTTSPATAIQGWGFAIGPGAGAAANPKGPFGHVFRGPFGGPI